LDFLKKEKPMSTMRDLEQRVSALEAENAALRAATPKAKASLPKELEGPSVTVIAPRGIPMPTPRELESLRSIVGEKYPALARPTFDARWADQDSEADRAGFALAFRWLSTLGRQDQLNNKLTPGAWCDRAEDFGRLAGSPARVRCRHVLAACVAAGDIAYAIDGWPHVIAIGVNHFGGSGRRATAAWRSVLKGQLISATRLPNQPPGSTEIRAAG
jgi:hypothetical protein